MNGYIENELHNNIIDRIIDDLPHKPLFIVADPGEGKTVLSKEIVMRFREKYDQNMRLQVFDPSLAWWYNSPLFCKVILTDDSIDSGIWRDESHTVYGMGSIETEKRSEFLGDILSKEYLKRVNKHLFDPHFVENVFYAMYVLEEAQTIFPKSGKLPKHVFDVITYGRNYKTILMNVTQRLSECRTEIVERCNVLCGYISGDNDREKLRRATSKLYKDRVQKLKTRSYEFLYYNGDIHGPVSVLPRHYGDPLLIHNNIEKLKNNRYSTI